MNSDFTKSYAENPTYQNLEKLYRKNLENNTPLTVVEYLYGLIALGEPSNKTIYKKHLAKILSAEGRLIEANFFYKTFDADVLKDSDSLRCYIITLLSSGEINTAVPLLNRAEEEKLLNEDTVYVLILMFYLRTHDIEMLKNVLLKLLATQILDPYAPEIIIESTLRINLPEIAIKALCCLSNLPLVLGVTKQQEQALKKLVIKGFCNILLNYNQVGKK
jgi:hypothetical protein